MRKCLGCGTEMRENNAIRCVADGLCRVGGERQ